MSNEHRKEYTPTGKELDRQMAYIKKIREINDREYERTGKKKSMCIKTYGCQMNGRDSEKLEGILVESGYHPSEQIEGSDLVVFNTCCVRENAENKVYGNLGIVKNIKQSKPDMVVALCGCMMQQDTVVEKILHAHRHVNIIFGTYNIHRFPELLYTHLETKDPVIDIWQAHGEIVEDLPSVRLYPYRSGVNIMFGCNNFCSYCIVPYVRGKERSRCPEDILQEIRSLVADGVKEVMLLGQNVNSYGVGLKNTPIDSFAKLLYEVNQIQGLERIRFMTSHPKDLSDELIQAMCDCEKVCRHLHLPVQSGSTKVLTQMNRKYTKEQYMTIVEKLRCKMLDLAITTDLIVGFPGETEEDFEETLDVVRNVRYANAFTFLYSPREGTPAAKMSATVSEKEMKDRFNRLLTILNPMIYERQQKKIGTTELVLAEEINDQNPALLTGRLSDNSLIHFEGNAKLLGKIVPVRIVQAKTFYLTGQLETD